MIPVDTNPRRERQHKSVGEYDWSSGRFPARTKFVSSAFARIHFSKFQPCRQMRTLANAQEQPGQPRKTLKNPTKGGVIRPRRPRNDTLDVQNIYMFADRRA
jgi:hypothetical protein